MSRIRANNIVNGAGTGAPTFPNGAVINGISTITANVQLNTSELTIGTGSTISNPSNNQFRILTNGGERLRITSGGNVGIGTDNPSKPLQVHSSSASAVLITGATPQLRLNSNVGDGTDADRVILGRATGNDQFISGSVDGDAILRCGTSKKVMIGYGTTEIAQFNSSGLKFKTSGMGVDFSATSDGPSMSSELLDDYEEGTFTPAFSFSNLSVSSYGTQQGSYVKVGRIVHVNVYVRFNGADLSGTPQTSGAVYINLPFTAGTGYNDNQYLSEPAALGRLAEFRGSNDSTNFDRIYHYIGNNNSSMFFGVNKQPCDPQSTDFLYGMSEKSFNGLIGAGNNFEYRHSFTYEAAS